MDTQGEREKERADNNTSILNNECFVHTMCLESTFYTSPDERAQTSTISTRMFINEPGINSAYNIPIY